MKGILAIDYDGTIATHCYPRPGEPQPLSMEVLKELREAGWKLILWTCREDEGRNINKRYLSDAIEMCREHGVEFDAVNESVPECDFRAPGPNRKPYCDYFIDDRNLGGFPGWDVVRRILIEDEDIEWTTRRSHEDDHPH